MNRLRGLYWHLRFLAAMRRARRRAKAGHRMSAVEQAVLHLEAANDVPGMSDEWRAQARAQAVREIGVVLGYEPGSTEQLALEQKLREFEAEALLKEANDD